jgi:esterase/lipase
MIWKTSEKRMKQKYKTKCKTIPTDYNKQKTESELEDKMVIKGKTEELLVKQLKTCKRNMQELTDSIKSPNLRIMGIEEEEEVQAKGISNIFNKIITEGFPNQEKTMPIQVQEASRTLNRPDQNRTTP